MVAPLFFNWDEVHPLARGPFMALADDLHMGYSLNIIPLWFRPFEGFRAPGRQAEVFKKGTSKARAWESAHQYGLAVDFVPFRRGAYTWEVSAADWLHLRNASHARGLLNDIAWDRAHVEHPRFSELRDVLKPRLTGSAP